MDEIKIPNYHAKACGPLPAWAIDRPKGSFFSYFEGSCGDQWIFLATPEVVRLACGDADWVTHQVVPTIKMMEKWKSCDGNLRWVSLVMNKEESLWLIACMASCASGLKYRLQESEEGRKKPSDA